MCTGGRVPLGELEAGPGRNHQNLRRPGLQLGGSTSAWSVHEAFHPCILQGVGEALLPTSWVFFRGSCERVLLVHPRPSGSFPWAPPPLMQPVQFQTMPREQLYMLVLHTFHFHTLMSCPNIKWWDCLPPVERVRNPAPVAQPLFHTGLTAPQGY